MSWDFTRPLNSEERSGRKDGRKNVFVIGDSMSNKIRERGISKQYSVKVKNFPGTTIERINEEFNNILQSKPNLIVIHAGTNDLATKINPLHNLRKILKKCNKLSPKTKLAFSNVIVRKDKVNLERDRKHISSRIKNFCQQKGIGYIDNSNITENHLGMKKLHLNSKGNTEFAKNLINFVKN